MNRYRADKQTRRWRYVRDVLRELVGRDFKLRYKRSFFGVAWSLLVPLAQLAVFYLVFKKIVPLQIPHYTSFLFTGILPWTWFQSSLMISALTIVDNRELVRQAGFPVALLPPVSVISHLVHFVLSLPVLAGFLLYDGYRPGPELVGIVIVIAVQFIMTLSLAYVFAALQVRFRDTQYLLGIGLFLAFYLTPVFWDDSMVPEGFRAVMQLNPVTVVISSYRAILLRQHWPDTLPLLAVGLGSVVALLLSYALFSMARDRFVEEL
jgi:lipopolysaccharide transport system permease protein